MQRTIVLAGEKVALAMMTEADQPYFQTWIAESPELRNQIGDQSIPTMENQMSWFKRVQEPDRKFFSLVTVPEQTLIGNCGFVNIDPTAKSATLRITIGNTEYHGKGLGSEAVQLLVRYAFETAGWSHLMLNVLPDNQRAIRTYEKAGFAVTKEALQDGRMIITMERTKP